MVGPITVTLEPPPQNPQGESPWRPPQWRDPMQTYIKASIKTSKGPATETFYFDAILRVEHNSELRVTDHPVQDGTNIVDHAYMLPLHLVLEIGMSDVMDVYTKGSNTQASTKSISAYQELLKLQQDRLPLEVGTRLNTYQNMIIERISAPDDHRTQFGLRCTVILRQIIMAVVGQAKVSVLPHKTDSTDRSIVQPARTRLTLAAEIENSLSGLWNK